MKKRKLTKRNLDELAKEMPIISESTLHIFVGGSGSESCPPSCVFNVFDYLDGDKYDACHYYEGLSNNYGITPNADGGVPTHLISEIGSYGGFSVKEVSNGDTIKTGGIATFKVGSINHAVVIKEFIPNGDGTYTIKYHDSTNGSDGQIHQSKCRLYNVTYTGQSESQSGNQGS